MCLEIDERPGFYAALCGGLGFCALTYPPARESLVRVAPLEMLHCTGKAVLGVRIDTAVKLRQALRFIFYRM